MRKFLFPVIARKLALQPTRQSNVSYIQTLDCFVAKPSRNDKIETLDYTITRDASAAGNTLCDTSASRSCIGSG